MKRYRVFDIGHDHEYFNDTSEADTNNRKILRKVSEKCYLPTNAIWLDLLKKNKEIKISYSLSGVVLEQMETWAPDVLESFQRLVGTGQVEILDETYYHSLAFLYSKEEFIEQVRMHRDKIRELFHVTPTSFRNTELVYHNDLASFLSLESTQKALGAKYEAVLLEGWDHVLGWRSPNFPYAPQQGTVKLLPKNYRLSDDVAFRFSSKDWKEWPLTAPKFANWVNAVNGNGTVVDLFMDYETFGEHQWADTGIFDFLKALPGEILKHPDNNFLTVSEAAKKYETVGVMDVPYYLSWADVERDISAWVSNGMQHDAIGKLYALRDEVLALGDGKLIDDFRKLTTSDHFYYMCTKWFADGDVHKYFNPYDTPYDAFIAYANILQDLRLRIDNHKKTKRKIPEVKSGKNIPKKGSSHALEAETRDEGKKEKIPPADFPSPIRVNVRSTKTLAVEHQSHHRSLKRKPRKV